MESALDRKVVLHPANQLRKVLVFECNDITRNRATVGFLLALSTIALYLCYLLVAPFLKPITFAIILAVLLHPVHNHIQQWSRNRNLAAALSTAGFILLITSVSFFVGRALVSGLHGIYDSLSGSGGVNDRLTIFIVESFNRTIAWASRYIPISVPNLQRAIQGEMERAVAGVVSATAGFAGGLSSFGLNAFITTFVLFFLLRDGRSMLRRAAVVLPFKADQLRRLFGRVRDTLNAIVYGTLGMAAIQGALTGFAFWFLGITSPVVWGLIAALFALLPVVGTTCVWLPATGMLFLSGHWIKAIVLIIWGLVIVHPVDNVLRPYLIGGRVKLSTLYVFFAVVGGLKAFGVLGLFIGPLILAVTVALFTFLREEKRAGSWGTQFFLQPRYERPDPIISMHQSQ